MGAKIMTRKIPGEVARRGRADRPEVMNVVILPQGMFVQSEAAYIFLTCPEIESIQLHVKIDDREHLVASYWRMAMNEKYLEAMATPIVIEEQIRELQTD